MQSAEYVEGYTIHIRFADGAEADVDLTDELWGEVRDWHPASKSEDILRFPLGMP